jgi:hypothetical protein
VVGIVTGVEIVGAFTCGKVFVCGTIFALAGVLTAGVSVLASSDLLPQLITVIIVNIEAK